MFKTTMCHNWLKYFNRFIVQPLALKPNKWIVERALQVGTEELRFFALLAIDEILSVLQCRQSVCLLSKESLQTDMNYGVVPISSLR